MNYRPEGWWNGWSKEREYDGMSTDAEIYEAGADAMLEALKAKSVKLPFRHTISQYHDEELYVRPDYKGWLVFIPEEEQ